MRTPLLATARAAVLCTLAAAAFAATNASADRDENRLEAKLRSYQEVPAVSSVAEGRFKATVDAASNTLMYELSFSSLEGDVRMAHIHLGQRGVNGGIMVWLCQTTTNPDPTGLSPTCPQSGTVTGLIQASAVIGPAGQGIAAAEFAEAVAAMRAGAAYVNVHTSKFPAGEIRGQVKD
jgi:hypothetical protein